MNHNQFPIFLKATNEESSIVNIPALIIGVTIIAIIVANQIPEVKRIKNLEIYAIFLGLVISAIVKRFQKNENKKEESRISGVVEFRKDKIIIESKEFPLNDIEKFTFYVEDYLNKIESTGIRGLPPKISTGTKNYCTLHLENQTKKQVFFQLKHKDHFVDIREELIYYYQQGKISWLRLLEILKIEKYEDIQEFKKTTANNRYI